MALTSIVHKDNQPNPLNTNVEQTANKLVNGHTTHVLKALWTQLNPKVKSISHSTLTCQYLDVEYSQDVVFDWGNLLLLLNEGTFKLIQ